MLNEKRKEERKSALKLVKVLFSPMNRIGDLSGKVSFCTSVRNMTKGSLAVETILVLPVFFLGVVTMISFMDIYKIQTEHLSALCENVKTAGMYAYVLDGQGPEEITLPDIYSYTPVSGLISLPKVWMYNTVKVHAWTGKTYESGEGSSDEIEEMVYITESGTVYHKDLGCSYLNVSVSQVAGSVVSHLKNANGQEYCACGVCSSGQEPAGIVYVTDYGNSYHNLESCSGLKRSVRMVKHSSTEGKAACSRCG